MRTEHQRSAGGIVVRGGDVLLIAVKEGKRWQLPKGHVEEGETAEEAAVREVREETGVTGRTVGVLPPIDYWFVEGGRRIHKTVEYFLLEYVSGSAADHDPREVSAAAWFGWQEGLDRLSFANERRVAEAARRLHTGAAEGRAGRAR